RHCVGVRCLLCRHHGCELETPFYPPYCFLNGDYTVFDCGSMAFSAADLKPLVRVCFSLPTGPLHSAFRRFRRHYWRRMVDNPEWFTSLVGQSSWLKAFRPKADR